MKSFESVDLEAGLDQDQIEAIEDQRTAAEVIASEGRTRYPSMTYEQGVRDALQWVLGEAEEGPMEDEL